MIIKLVALCGTGEAQLVYWKSLVLGCGNEQAELGVTSPCKLKHRSEIILTSYKQKICGHKFADLALYQRDAISASWERHLPIAFSLNIDSR
jgi:hypothetical protein